MIFLSVARTRAFAHRSSYKIFLSLSSAAFYWAPAPLYVITDKTTIFYTIFHSRDFYFFADRSCLDSRWLLYKKKSSFERTD